MNYFKNLLQLLRSVPAHIRFVLALVSAMAAAPMAGAQALDLTTSIQAFGGAMQTTIATNAPPLFLLMAFAVGFYFLWGRIRSLF